MLLLEIQLDLKQKNGNFSHFRDYNQLILNRCV